MSEPNEDGKVLLHAEIPQELQAVPDPALFIPPGSGNIEGQQLLAYWGHLLSINRLAHCQTAVDFVLQRVRLVSS